MSRDQLLGRKVTTKEIQLDDGTPLRIRKLSQAAVETMKQKYATDAKTAEGFRYIVCQCVVDEDGKRVFNDGDMARIGTDMPFEDTQTIASEVFEYSGMLGKSGMLNVGKAIQLLAAQIEAATGDEQAKLTTVRDWLQEQLQGITPKKS